MLYQIYSGPTVDGRIKPDLIAPGIGITSANGYSEPGECRVSTSSGTSLSSPLLAGTAALVRQYFTDGYYPEGKQPTENGFVPMAALIKAVLVNSGERLTGSEATLQVLCGVYIYMIITNYYS